MRPASRRPLIAFPFAALLLGLACAHENPPVVSEVRDQYNQVSDDPDVSQNASLELYEAQKAVEHLERAAARDENLDQATYVARRRIEIARIAGEAGVYEVQIDELAEQRDLAQLEAESNKARRAEVRADLNQAEATTAKRQAALAMERAKELEAKVGDLEAKATARGVVLTMRNVLFGFDRASLEPGATRSLRSVAEYLNEFPDRNVVIEGYTDSAGNKEYNERLSQERAQAVAEFLQRNGVQKDRLTTRGNGEAMPVAPNDNAAGRQKNRRVEIILEEGQA